MTPRFLLLVTGLALSALAAVAIASSITPARAAGEVTIDFQTSSSHAARHPDVRVTIENHSAGDITSATMSLPVGFMGSLNATVDGPDGDTEGDRCPWIDDAADFIANCAGVDVVGEEDLADRAKIGTVKNIAHLDNTTNDNTTILNGSVYLTDRNPAETGDAAGMVIVVDAKVSDLDLGKVVVPVRMKLRYEEPRYTSVVNPQGVDTIVESVPTSITDPLHGTINFTIDKIVLDIMGDPPGGASPLITTPSDCGTGPLDVLASFTTTDPGAPTVDATDTHTPDNCDKLAFEPVLSTFTVSDNGATDLVNDIDIGLSFPAGGSTVRNAIVDLPREFVANPPGVSGNCPTAVIETADPSANCPDTANLGTATVTSPLLAYPVVGEILGEDVTGGSLPRIYMVFKDPDIGLDARIRGSASVIKTGTSQAAAGDFVRTTLNLQSDGGAADLPSLPLSSMVINLHREDAGTVLPDAGLSTGPILKISTGPACNATSAARFILIGWNGAVRQLVSPVLNFNCGANGQTVADAINITSGPVNGETVTTDSVTFTLQNNHTGTVRMRTSVDDGSNAIAFQPYDSNLESYASTPSTTAGNNRVVTIPNLVDGTVYKFLVQANDAVSTYVDQERRTFKVDLPGEGPEAADTIAPAVQIDAGPADESSITDTTPSWTFSGTDDTTAGADIEYQCSLDGGAFETCGSGASGSFDSPALLTATNTWDPNHKFSVRSEDEWGNVSTPVTHDFDIDIPFGPAVAITPTTVAARSHPEMEVDITNGATEDIETFNFKMPKGFLGSLLGAPAQCTVAQADSATCPAGSQIGTVEATAQIDQSEATLPGKVYLTVPLQAGDPAGIAVVIDSQLGDIDLEKDVVVKARLAVRGQAEGVDAFSEPMPRTAHDNVKNVDVTFRARHINMKLTGNVAGTQPFLWAASDCSPGQEYVADFESYDSDTSQTIVPFTTTGCDALPFDPKLSLNIAEAGGTGAPTAGENFTAVANMVGSPLDSGIKSAEVTLPRTVTLDARQVPENICEAAQIAAHTCPPESLAGTATVNTPLLATPLTGPVYMARNPGKAVPNLSVQLSGLISIDLFASSKFVNQTQINTTFNSVPDAPMTSFSMSIDKMLIMQETACKVPIEERGLKGTATGFNGKAASLDTPPLPLDCKDDLSVSSTFKNKGKKSTLSITATANGLHPKTKKAQLKLPRGLKMVKKALKKKLLVTGDGRRLKTNCWKFKNASTLDLSLCKKQYDVIKLSFKAKSLTATKKVKTRTKFTLKITPASGKAETLKPPLSTKRYPPL